MPRLFPRPHSLLALLGLAVFAIVSGLLLGGGGPAHADPTCTATFTGSAGGDWATATNWSGGRVPGDSGHTDDVVCWSNAPTLNSGNYTVAGVQGTGLTIAGGSLTLSANGTFTLTSLTVSGGQLGGTGSLGVAGPITWSAGQFSGPNGSTLTITQTGNHAFTQTNPGNSTEYFYNTALSTDGPVTLAGNFTPSVDSITTTSAAGVTTGNNFSGVSQGINITTPKLTTQGTSNLSAFNLTLTGTSGSTALTGTTQIGSLTVPAGYNLAVPTGVTLRLDPASSNNGGPGGTVHGTISGAGTLQSNEAVTIAPDGALTVNTVNISNYTLTAAAGSTFTPTTTTINGGALQVDTTAANASTSSLTLSSGYVQGSGALTVTGPITWSGGQFSGPNGSTLTITQTGNHAFTQTNPGNSTEYFYNTALSTDGPVTLAGNFTPSVDSITTTSAAGVTTGNNFSGVSQGINITTPKLTTQGTSNLSAFNLTLTGTSGSTALTGTTQIGSLTVPAGYNLAVPTGVTLRLDPASSNNGGPGGTVHGTISGAGTLQSNEAVTIAPDGALTVNTVNISNYTLTAAAGSTFTPTTTTINGGALQVDTTAANASTSSLTLSSGYVQGSGALTVTGPITWSGGQFSGPNGSTLTITQTGNHAFTQTNPGNSTEYFYNTALSTDGPVTLAGNFTPSTASITATGSTGSLAIAAGISLGQSMAFTTPVLTLPGNASGTMTNLGNSSLTITGATTLSTGNLNVGGGVTVAGGQFTLGSPATLQAAVTITTGTLAGTGTVSGAVTNNGGTLAPGDPTNSLSVTSYTQGASGTLHITATSGSTYSRLYVSGSTTPSLAGTLSIADPGYTPDSTTRLPVISCPSCTSAINLANLTLTDDVTRPARYVATASATSVVLSVVSAPTVGLSQHPGEIDVAVSGTDPSKTVQSYTVAYSTGGGAATSVTSGATPVVITGLQNGSAYSVTVYVTYTDASVSPTSLPENITPAGLPGAPSLTAQVTGQGQITVSVGAAAANGSPLTAYAVTLAGPGSPSTTFGPAGGTFVFNGLSDSTAYTPTATASNGVGTGPSTALAAITTPPTPPPGAVTGVTAISGNAQATISFVAPVGGTAPTSYIVTLTPVGGGAPITVTTTGSPVLVTGLANATTYSISVVAQAASGLSPAGGAGVTVTPHAPPTAPHITGIAPSPSTLLVGFTQANGAGLKILSDTVTCVGTNHQTAVRSGTSSPVKISGLHNGINYRCTVTALTSAGISPVSNVVIAHPGKLPSVVLKVVASAKKGTRITIVATITAAGDVVVNRLATLSVQHGGHGKFSVLAKGTTNSKGQVTYRVVLSKTSTYQVRALFGPAVAFNHGNTVQAL